VLVPTFLGRLHLVARAGEGGSGRVYEGRELPFGREVAVKLLHSGHEQFQSLQREARLAAALRHEHIVDVYGYEEIDGHSCLITEWLPGGSLEERLRDRGRLPEEDVLRLAGHCLRALEACHRIQLVHGDIKPANILFDGKGRAKIADFGIAHIDPVNRGWRRDIRGTVLYVAPEKARGKNENHKSDLYGLAAVLWHCLAGRAPFEAPGPNETLDLRLDRPAPSVREVNPAVTRLTDALLLKLMDPNPATRPGSFSAIKAELHRARTELARVQKGPAVEPPTVIPLPGAATGMPERVSLGDRVRDTMRTTASFFRRTTIRLRKEPPSE
jgi:serine/threonine protein kinase